MSLTLLPVCFEGIDWQSREKLEMEPRPTPLEIAQARLPELKEHVDGVDLLVTEATYLDRDKDMARRFGHTIAAEAAWLAREAGARMLVLNHLSQRYRIRHIVDEVQAIFEPVVVARDFDRFAITRDKITLSNQQLDEDAEPLEEEPPPDFDL